MEDVGNGGDPRDKHWDEGSSSPHSFLDRSSTRETSTGDLQEGDGGRPAAFLDFEERRKRLVFGKGEVWATFDEYGAPRRYAQVLDDTCSHLTAVRFLVHKEWDRRRWYNESGALRAHGVFIVQYWVSNLDSTAFSHRVQQGVMTDSNYYIYPRKGQVWAVTKGIDEDTFDTGSPTTEEYWIVEVLEDFSLETGVRAVYMMKVRGGYRSLFRRRTGVVCEHFAYFPPNELNRFSHQVPYVVVTGESALMGCLELDPLSLPVYIDDFENDTGQEIDDRYLCLGFLDSKIRKRQFEYRNGSVWAAYDDSCGLPLSYVVLDSVTSQPELKAKMLALEFHPVSEEEKRWYNAGFPVTCGYFRMKKNCVQENLSLSHPVFHKYDFFELVGKSCYYIFPKTRHVWGIYKDTEDEGIGCKANEKGDLEYDIVEISGCFGSKKKPKGIKARYLERVEGFKCLFRRSTEYENLRIPWDQLYRFSHHIPSYKFRTKGSFLEKFFVLDPLLAPAIEGDEFRFSDPSLLVMSRAYPLSSAIKYFTGNEVIGEHSEKATESSDEENERESAEEEAHEVEGKFSTSDPKLKFHYFDDCEAARDFESGQVWALYNDYDGIPRSYVRINGFVPVEAKVDVSLLEFYPTNDEEIKWAEENLPLGCGAFRASKLTALKELSVLSHRVAFDEWEGMRSFYKIFPKKNEVWAIYKNWDIDWTGSSFKNYYEYKLVEIVSDFGDGSELTVAALSRVEGCEATFERQLHEGFGLFHKFSRKDLPRFSHRIPSVRGMGAGSSNAFQELWKIKFSHQGM